MGRQGKSGVRLLGKCWQEKEPATAQVTEKYHAGRAPDGRENHHDSATPRITNLMLRDRTQTREVLFALPHCP